MMAKIDALREALRSEPPPAAPAGSLEPLLNLYRESLMRSQQVIESQLESHVRLIPKVAHHLLDAGGKRVRSLLLLASADLTAHLSGMETIGETQSKIFALTAVVELIHTATLLHDDVVDDSKMRRGKPTANQQWDNKLPVLVGDYLFSRAFTLMVSAQSLPVLEVLSQISARLAEGEVLQLSYERDFALPYNTYIDIISAKTASLFSASCRAGAMLEANDDDWSRAMADFGHRLGIVFQMSDDIIDYSQPHQTTGKRAGDDLREGKVTLPLILLREKIAPAEQQRLAEMIRTGADDEDFAYVQKLMTDCGVIAEARAHAQQHADEARQMLQDWHEAAGDNLQAQAIIEALQSMLDFFVKRPA